MKYGIQINRGGAWKTRQVVYSQVAAERIVDMLQREGICARWVKIEKSAWKPGDEVLY